MQAKLLLAILGDVWSLPVGILSIDSEIEYLYCTRVGCSFWLVECVLHSAQVQGVLFFAWTLSSWNRVFSISKLVAKVLGLYAVGLKIQRKPVRVPIGTAVADGYLRRDHHGLVALPLNCQVRVLMGLGTQPKTAKALDSTWWISDLILDHLESLGVSAGAYRWG